MITANQSKRQKRSGILIVEDEQLVAWDVEQILSDQGFDPIYVTPSLRGARTALEEQGHRIALAILDLKLVDGDGRALVDEVLHRGIPALVMTGYSNFCHARVPVLYKPFFSVDLVACVNSLLGHRS